MAILRFAASLSELKKVDMVDSSSKKKKIQNYGKMRFCEIVQKYAGKCGRVIPPHPPGMEEITTEVTT